MPEQNSAEHEPEQREQPEQLSNRERALDLRAKGMTMREIQAAMGLSSPSRVHDLLKSRDPIQAQTVARIEQASRTLAEIAESTRQMAGEVFEIGLRRARRRIQEVEGDPDDHGAKTVLETAKLATEGARIVHGWGDQSAGASGRVAIQVIGDLRGLLKEKTAQSVDVETVPATSDSVADLASHQIPPEQEQKP